MTEFQQLAHCFTDILVPHTKTSSLTISPYNAMQTHYSLRCALLAAAAAQKHPLMANACLRGSNPWILNIVSRQKGSQRSQGETLEKTRTSSNWLVVNRLLLHQES